MAWAGAADSCAGKVGREEGGEGREEGEEERGRGGQAVSVAVGLCERGCEEIGEEGGFRLGGVLLS